MPIKRQQTLSRDDFDQAVVQLRLNVSEIAKAVGIPRTYLSEFRNGDRVLRPEHQAKLRDYFEGKGVEFEDPAHEGIAGGQPKVRPLGRRIGRTVPKPAFVLPDETISEDLHADTVDAIADRLDQNARRIEILTRQPIKRGFFDNLSDDGLSDLVRNVHTQIVQLLAEEALLRRRLEGNCIIPPVDHDKAQPGAKVDSHGELLSQKFNHLNEGDLAVGEALGDADPDTDTDSDPDSDSDAADDGDAAATKPTKSSATA